MDIGSKISRLRKQNNMTQKGFAEKLHVTDKAVSRWESGLGNPDIRLLPDIARTLNVTVDYLLSEDTDSTENSLAEVVPAARKSTRKKWLVPTLIVGGSILLLGGIGVIAGIVISAQQNELAGSYAQGITSMEAGDYEGAITIFDALSYKDSKNKVIVCKGLMLLDSAKQTKDESVLRTGVEMIVSAGTEISVHYDGNGRAIVEDQYRYDTVFTNGEHALLVPSTEGLVKWINQSSFYLNQNAYLYLSAVWG